MATYLVHGSITFSSTTNAQNALAAMQTQVAGFPEAVASSRGGTAGISRSSAVVNFSYEVPEERVTAFITAVRNNGWALYTRSSILASAVRIGDA